MYGVGYGVEGRTDLDGVGRSADPRDLTPPARDPGQLLHRNVQRFRGRLVLGLIDFEYHSTLGLRVIKKKRRSAVYFPLPNEEGTTYKVLRTFT